MIEKLSNEQKMALIGQFIGTPEGRAKLAASMQQPLRNRRDYTSVGRKAALVEQLPDGALPIYDKDPEVTAYVIGEEGENILAVTKPRRVIFPLFEIASNPEIPLTQIRERRYDLIERAQNLAKSQIQAAEDSRLFDVVDAVSVNGFDNLAAVNPQVNANAPLNPGNLADAFAQVEKWDNRVARVFVNALDYADIRKWGRDVLDIETQATLLKTGMMATVWGAQIIVTRQVDPGYMYVLAEPEFVGRIPVRTELTVLSADDPKARRIGFSCFEQLGIGVHNPLGLVRIKIAR
jgi:hypothetical protein